MKTRHRLLAAAFTALTLTGWSGASGNATRESIAQICGAESRPASVTGEVRIVIEPGMGDGGFKVRTKSPAAQAWFDYGVKLFHAFYHADNKAAFDKAVAADPDCAMCLWGQALSRGPTQNFDVNAADTAKALDIARKARAAAVTPLEIQLTDAMVTRYTPLARPAAPASPPSPAGAGQGVQVEGGRAAGGAQGANANSKIERDFADAVLNAAKLEPDNTDLRLIAAESLMTAWRRGDKQAVQPALAIIEPILKRDGGNTAAIHYYIHATEFAGEPTKALPYAKRLASLAPRASHLVHMAAHTFLRVGLYEDAAEVNALSLGADAVHMTATNTPGPLSGAYYYTHDLRFGMAGAMMSGDSDLALRFADHVRKAYPQSVFASDLQSSSEGQSFIIFARYAPFRMLAIGEPAENRPATRAFYHYARGEAFAVRRDLTGLKREAEAMPAGNAMQRLQKAVLEGRLAMAENRYDDAADAFGRAATIQETTYASSMDPPPFWYPVRRSVAAARLAAGKYGAAADEARKSLAAWPSDPMALLVLGKAEQGQNQGWAARGHLRQARRLWEGDISKVTVETI